MAHQFDNSVVVAFQYITLVFEYIVTILLFLESFGIFIVLRMLLNASIMHSGLYSNGNYHLDCLYREVHWSACLSFPIFAICFFTSSNEKYPIFNIHHRFPTQQLCREDEVGFVDLWDSFVGKEEMYLRDGLHLSGKGLPFLPWDCQGRLPVAWVKYDI